MGFFSKLFGKKEEAKEEPPAQSMPTPPVAPVVEYAPMEESASEVMPESGMSEEGEQREQPPM